MDETRSLNYNINTAIKGHNINTLIQYLSTSVTSKIFNQKTIKTLLRILKRDGKHEDKIMHVSCVLSCLQHFLDLQIDSQEWEEVADNISKLCEHLFVISTTYIEDDILIQKSVTVISAIIEHNRGLVDNIIRYMLESLLKTASSSTCSSYIMLLVLGLIGNLLQRSSREARLEIIPSITIYLEKLSNKLFVCGDYEIQVSVIEVLARCWSYIKETEHCPVLFSDRPDTLPLFNKYNFLNFDPDCRLFLNEVNSSVKDLKLVYSIPCMVVCADNKRLKKPNDPSYKEFWVDLNLNSRCISFYYMLNNVDGWELMKIENDHVLSVAASNSFCKSKTGEVIAAIKIEFILNSDFTQSELPKALKIYTHLTNSFEKLEEAFIKDIFGSKYKSEVTYDQVTQPSMNLKDKWRSAQELTRLNKTAVTIAGTSVEVNTLPSQLADNRAFNSSDVPGPSFPSPIIAKNVKTSVEEQLQTHQFITSMENECGRSTRDLTNIFIKQLDKEENAVIEDSDPEDEILRLTNEEHSSIKKDMSSNNILISTNKNHPETIILQSLDKNNVSPKILPLDSTTTPLKNTKASVNSIPHRSNQKQDPVATNTGSILKKRRLYSSENINTKDLVLSSQEDFSVEIPEYKLTKQETKIESQENSNKKNVSYSYISYKEEQKLPVHDNVLFDGDEIKEISDDEKSQDMSPKNIQVLKSPPINFNFFKSNAKKLSFNSTPKSIFPSDTVYSEFPSSDRDKHLKRTYARPKPRRGHKRVKVMKIVSSGSDSDYLPPRNITSECTTPRQNKKRTSKNLDPEGFVNRLPHNSVDLTRDFEFLDEMELEHITLEEVKTAKGRNLKIPPVETINNNVQKESKVTAIGTKKNVQKTNNNKTKKVKRLQSKKTKVRKGQGTDETSPKDITTVVPMVMDVINCEPVEPTSLADNDDLALDILNCPVSQDKSVLQMTFKINEMVQFGKCCLMEVNSKVQKSQNLAQKEREMNFATFDFKTQSLCADLYSQCEKLHAVSNNLIKAKTLLDAAFNFQKDITAQIQSGLAELEEAKLVLTKNITKIEKTESSHISTIFQGLSRYIKNLVLSFIEKTSSKKLMPK